MNISFNILWFHWRWGYFTENGTHMIRVGPLMWSWFLR